MKNRYLLSLKRRERRKQLTAQLYQNCEFCGELLTWRMVHTILDRDFVTCESCYKKALKEPSKYYMFERKQNEIKSR